jgi:ubiquinone/menaquinone biosynthesis C-methylase UbiE
VLAWLDPFVLRRPFEGRAALRYARDARPAFAELDARLLERLAPELASARRFLDVGAGTGAFAARVARAHPSVEVIAVEPSATFGTIAETPLVRGRAEALPVESASIDVAICLSSLRHVRDRPAALRELRRVVRPGGAAYVVELDPDATRARARAHAAAMQSAILRLTFDPFVLRTCAGAPELAAQARAAGWASATYEPDPSQPFYVLRLGPA